MCIVCTFLYAVFYICHQSLGFLKGEECLGSIVGFSQYTANFIYVHIYCVSRGRHVSASILGHLQVHRSLCSLHLALQGAKWSINLKMA